MYLLAQAAETVTVSTFDWPAAIGAITLAITTLGSAFAAVVGIYMRRLDLQQKAMEAKIEADKLELSAKLELARLEAEKQGRRTRHANKRVKAVQADIQAVKKQTNGMQEQLLKEVEARARHEGRIEGTASTIKEVVKEAVTEVLPVKPAPPIDVNVVNSDSNPIPVAERKEGQA